MVGLTKHSTSAEFDSRQNDKIIYKYSDEYKLCIKHVNTDEFCVISQPSLQLYNIKNNKVFRIYRCISGCNSIVTDLNMKKNGVKFGKRLSKCRWICPFCAKQTISNFCFQKQLDNNIVFGTINYLNMSNSFANCPLKFIKTVTYTTEIGNNKVMHTDDIIILLIKINSLTSWKNTIGNNIALWNYANLIFDINRNEIYNHPIDDIAKLLKITSMF